MESLFKLNPIFLRSRLLAALLRGNLTSVMAREIFALLAPPTFSKELERMANFRVPVLLLDLALNLFNRTRINHYCDVSTFGTDNMIVVLPWIEKFIVTARPIQKYFLGDLQPLKKGHNAEHRRVVRDGPFESRPGLNFIER